MDVNEFAVVVSKLERGKKQVNIAQIKELLKIIRRLLLALGVDLYKLIRVM